MESPEVKELPKKKQHKILLHRKHRQTLKAKKAKLIIRNLSFEAEEADLESVFSKCGAIKEIIIPKKPDGKKRGFAFILYDNTKSVLMAIKQLNNSKIKGRNISVDYAFSKDKFQVATGLKPATKISKPQKNTDETSDNEESDDWSDEEDEKEQSDEDSEKEEGQEQSEEDMEEESENEESDEDMEDEESDSSPKKKNATQKDDGVSEGSTLFFKNASFDVESDDIKSALASFGPIRYCVLCRDKETDYPKGTGFVKFVNKADAETCLSKARDEPIFLDGRNLEFFPAKSRGDLTSEKSGDKKDKKQNKRNTHLMDEGKVSGSQAKFLSPQDNILRLRIQKDRENQLKNLHKRISDTRLIVYNIPESYEDEKLKEVFKKAGGDQSKVTEARIIKDLKTLDKDGKPTNRGFGFVNFASHEHALKALRIINNADRIFKKKKKPCVYFAVEDIKILKMKQRRQENNLVNLQESIKNSKEAKKQRRLLKRKEKRNALKKESTEDSSVVKEEVSSPKPNLSKKLLKKQKKNNKKSADKINNQKITPEKSSNKKKFQKNDKQNKGKKRKISEIEESIPVPKPSKKPKLNINKASKSSPKKPKLNVNKPFKSSPKKLKSKKKSNNEEQIRKELAEFRMALGI